MPEGPEHHLAARYINNKVSSLIFHGQIVKSEVANNAKKHPDVLWNDNSDYKIHAMARGKEVKLILTTIISENVKSKEQRSKPSVNGHALPRKLNIFFQFGMSGYFRFARESDIPKHAHLRFFTKDDTKDRCVLCFVDPRRFGKWRLGEDWSEERGPDPALEYDAFRSNILENVEDAAFNRPICETLLNQKFFNGIGNYLRSEILYRAKIAPFECSRNVLETLIKAEDNNNVKPEGDDILKLCSTVFGEVLTLDLEMTYDPDNKESYARFKTWLQCYYNPSMKTMVDHNGRTIWFHGTPGPMVPKSGKSRERNLKRQLPNAQIKKENVKETVKETKVEQKEERKKSPKSEPKLLLKNVNYEGRVTRSMAKRSN